MTDTRDPRYLRTVGLTLLAALLVVASCEVERPPTALAMENRAIDTPAEPPIATDIGGSGQIPSPQEARRLIRENPGLIRQQLLQSGLSESEIRAQLNAAGLPADALDQFLSGDSIQAMPQEIRPQDAAAIRAGPVFTPMTVRPELRNRTEVQAALMREYPPILRDAGIGGRVVVWFYISDEGFVRDRRISQPSGQAQLDAAALNVAEVIRFTPALNGTEQVAVWIEVPITFVVN